MSSGQNEIHFLGEQGNLLNKIEPFMNIILEWDKPDGFSKIGDEVFIFEHFEFDSSTKSIKKGSRNRQEIARVSRESYKMPSVDGAIMHDCICCEYKMKQYVDNAINVFNDHYGKITSYKERLSNENIISKKTSVRTVFFIEDVTVLGNIDANTGNPIFLVLCDKFLELFEKSPDVDYIFSFSNFGMVNYVWFLSRDFIDIYKRNQINVDKIEIANLTPRVMSSIHKF